MEEWSALNFEEFMQPVATYRGEGHIEDKDQKVYHCDFFALQLPDANIFIKCKLAENSPEKTPSMIEYVPDTLQGITRDGASVRASLYPFIRRCTITSAGEIIWTVIAKDLLVTLHSSKSPLSLIRFELTNFEIPCEITLNVGDYKVTLKRLMGYEERLTSVKDLRGVDVISEAIIEIDRGDCYGDVCELMDDLCLLFTLARGIKINWIYYEVFSNKQKWVKRYHQNVVTKPYSPFPLISRTNPHDLKMFVEHTYPYLRKLKLVWRKQCDQEQRSPWWYQQAVDAFADAKLEQDFLELRGLKLASLLDFIRSVYLRDKNAEHIVAEDEFRMKLADLEKELRKVLQRFFSYEQAREMCKHVEGLNWPTFRQTLRNMSRDLGLAVSEEELNEIVTYRNELVHRMCFFKESKKTGKARKTKRTAFRAYFTMMNYVAKILLAILRYQGYYLDWTKDARWEDNNMTTRLSLNEVAITWPDY